MLLVAALALVGRLVVKILKVKERQREGQGLRPKHGQLASGGIGAKWSASMTKGEWGSQAGGHLGQRTAQL